MIPVKPLNRHDSWSGRRILFHLLVTVLLSGGTEGFQLSPIRSYTYQENTLAIGRHSSTTALAVSNSQPFDLSSGLISTLAVVALKARLIEQTTVECDVTAGGQGLILGKVGPVTVKGRGWQSGLGLTCRAIEATVEVCELDKARVVVDRKLILQQPARGRAMIALDSNDFGNFLVHPLNIPPNNLQFLSDNVSIDASIGAVGFDAMLNDEKWRCTLRRGTKGEPRAVVAVSPPSEGVSEESDIEALTTKLTDEVTTYFNDIVFELDGTFLTFRDMMVTDKGSSPSVMLKMGIKVVKFPSRNLAF